MDTMARSFLNSLYVKYELWWSASATNAPLVLLGKHYRIQDWAESRLTQDFDKGKPPHLDPFLYDFQSRFWITYRSEIPITPEFPFSSDAGWGCMIRSGQMLIAQAYACYFLGRDWLVTTGDFPYLYWRILHMFRDLDEPSSPFSIQNIMKVGARLGVSAGEWLSPTLIGDILCCLMTKLKRFDIGFYVCRSGTLPKDDFCAYALATGVWKPTIVYIPVRLGLSTINPIYAPQILKVNQTYGEILKSNFLS
eukprot:TRINITY_DN2024_c0_g1_i1.p1 TRINITY_DN2024_c0_g1~~TRINITY_DN2024_c0_g1_i1.p1  ORF type:complete len:251 (-),score=20.35 TRINITY_DN2024_c0_g1_i1:101-853(-)